MLRRLQSVVCSDFGGFGPFLLRLERVMNYWQKPAVVRH